VKAGILSYGAYIPFYRISRAEMGKAWGIPSLPGERAVANRDEDSLTMAIEAGLEALVGIDPASVDAVFFCSTTPPYAEKQCASIAALALDLRPEVYTADFTGTTRAATVALRAALDAVESGSARRVLVIAGDSRPGEPQTTWEQLLGDAGAAVLVDAEAPARVSGWASMVSEVVGPWRRPQDRYVRSFEPKLETEYGYVRATAQACRAVLEKCGLEPSQLSRAALYSPDLRSVADVARQAGLDRSQLQDPLLMTVGNAGAAHALLVLAAALDQAQEGQRLLLANYGDGADALVLELEGPLPRPQGRRSVAQYLASKRDLPGYGAFAAMRNLADRPEPRVHSSPVTYWRDVAVELRWHGARCLACGVVQYPIPRVCRECNARDNFQEVKLSRRGTVFTYTLDHLYANEYLDTPIPRAVIDLEGGGRVFLEVTDCDPQEVRWGMTLETTFRRLHEGAEFHNYYWRARPVRE
jgi:3-hydroxy-3-methylglutaryl CoA synthase